ncbi:MAG: MarC family protein [Phycisphaerae bacterium]
MSIVSATLLLFLVMDPLGNLPPFVVVLGDVDPQRRFRVLLRELVAAYLVLLGFLLVGRYLVGLLRVSLPALAISGGVILFLVSIRMVFPSTRTATETHADHEPFLVPLAVPLIAGPATMALLLILSTRHPEDRLELFLSLTLAWLAGAVILSLSGWIARRLGKRIVRVIERLMGMVLIVPAVQMLLDGVQSALSMPTEAPITQARVLVGTRPDRDEHDSPLAVLIPIAEGAYLWTSLRRVSSSGSPTQ